MEWREWSGWLIVVRFVCYEDRENSECDIVSPLYSSGQNATKRSLYSIYEKAA